MAMHKKSSRAYSIGSPLVDIAPEPIISSRAPKTSDRAESGTVWVYKDSSGVEAVYVMGGIVVNNSIWKPVYRAFTKISVASPASSVDLNAIKGCITLTGYTTAGNASFDFTIVNTLILESDPIMVSACTNSSNNSGIIIARTETVDNGLILNLWNSDTGDAINGDIIITFDLMK